jgi:hypothetical protein
MVRVVIRIGYIPLSADDPHFIAEQGREIEAGFPLCKCSNYNPEAAQGILHLLPQMTKDNFDQILTAPLTIPKDELIVVMIRKRKAQKAKATCNLSNPAALHLVNSLITRFEIFCENIFVPSSEFTSSDFFGIQKAKSIVASLNQIGRDGPHDLNHLERMLGGEFFPGQVECISNGIKEWYESDYFHTVLEEQRSHEQFILSEAKRLRDKIHFAREDVQILDSTMAAESKQQKKEVADQARKQKADEKAVEKALAASIKKRKAKTEKAEKALAAEMKKQKAVEIAQEKAEEKKMASIQATLGRYAKLRYTAIER